MPVATIEFLLAERPVRVEIEFAKGSIPKDILPLIEQKLLVALRRARRGNGLRQGVEKDLLSSFIMTRNGRIADSGTRLDDRDQIRIFHLLDGG